MKRKDFTASAGRVYETIATATADTAEQIPQAQEAQAEQEAPQAPQTQAEQSTPKERKPRKEYSAEDTLTYLQNMRTAGRKGVKLPRINLAFAPDVYEYIQIMSRVRGESMTDFVNIALRQHKQEHSEIFDKAMEFRNSL